MDITNIKFHIFDVLCSSCGQNLTPALVDKINAEIVKRIEATDPTPQDDKEMLCSTQ